MVAEGTTMSCGPIALAKLKAENKVEKMQPELG